MTIAELLARREPVVNVLTKDQHVSEAVRIMVQREVGAVLVVEHEHLVGIFTEQDVVRRVLDKGSAPGDVTLGSVMTAAPVTTTPDDEVDEAVRRMQRVRCRHLPVLMDGQVADTLSMRDLLATQLDEREQEVEELQSYIRGEPNA